MTSENSHYDESEVILQRITESKKIILNCHHNPDADSVGSALSMYQYLKSIGKEAEIICPSTLPLNLSFLPFSENIKTVDFKDFDFSSYDLFIAMDSASWNRISGNHNIPLPSIEFIDIDHHKTNRKFGKINLIQENMSSNSEIIYNLFKDWEVKLDKNIATTILTGIIGDTGAFRFPEANAETLKVAGELLSLGADKDEIIKKLYKSYSKKQILFWTEIMKNFEFNEEGKFVWSAVPKEIYQKSGTDAGSKSEIADIFFQNVEGTSFGMVLVEEEEGLLTVSFRSRDGFDVSTLASALGGGGHLWASAARITGLSYKDAVEKVVNTAIDFAKK